MSLALGLLLWNLTKTKGEVSKRRETARLETSMCETGKQITRSHGGREQGKLGKMSRSRVKEGEDPKARHRHLTEVSPSAVPKHGAQTRSLNSYYWG